MQKLKEIEWIGTAKKDLSNFPKAVRSEVGYSLYRLQEGKIPRTAKPLHGLGAGVMEIVSDYNTNTYRAVYVINLNKNVYVLHCFQKKSKRGIETPKEEIQRIKQRLKWLKLEMQHKEE